MGNQNICNICGANYEYRNGRWKCPACGAYKAEELSNEEVTLFYNAAQKLRLCDFDEAEKAYIDIIEKFPKNANGYWGRLLSRYGIKYEEDFDGRKIPTCYAASIESVLSDKDYHKALELADADTKAYFEQQAQYIERVRKEWIERAKKEKPYDIFICYKDSDLANGIDRTQDSIAAQDLYIHLTEQGYRVFFSRESLRDKVGEKYEPYIFNALSTAKVMLVYGTSSEYITSTWLKNEWTRYEKRLQAGEKKPNSLIVACDGFSPAELPKALSSMQCFDATKRSFYTDLDVVLKKIIKGEGKPKPVTKENKEKKKSKKLPVAIATISALIAVFLCILIPNLLNTQPVTSIVDSKYGVVITAQEGVFDKNTTVNVERLSDGTQYESLVSAVNDSKSIELQNAIIYDINCDADINTNVTVKVPYAKDKADSTVKVYYVSDNKSTVEEHSCTYDNGSVEFKTTHLSYYVVGEIVTENDDSSDNQDGNNDNQTIIERIGVRTITFSDKFTAEYALAQWESGEKTEESMIAIMDRYGEQQGGGKLHIITPGEFIEEVDTWCFSFERKVGDYAIIENAYGYSLCYISSINPTDTEIEDDSEDGTGDDVTPIPPEVKETTIKFDANGGNGSMSEQTITVGESANLKECSYTKSGYTFSGWATTASGSVVYTNRASFNAESESEITLYAIWTREKFSISFDANGGTGSIDPIEFNSGDSIETPFNTFVKNGYDFIGWSNTKDGTVTYIEGATYTFTSNQTLYAIWRLQEPDKVELIYNANGGTGIMSSQLLLPNQEISLNENMFTRNGYGFRGWSLTPNGEIVYSNMDDFTMGTTSITLYAVWKATDTAIVLNPNGAQGQATTIMSSTDKTITLPLNEFSRDGYTFIGWATTNSGEVIYNNGAEYLAGPNASYNLYAVWEANTNTLYFNANGGSGSMSPLYIQTNVQVQLTENSFTRDGYDFAGWATSPSGNVAYENKATYIMGTNASNTLYAVWTALPTVETSKFTYTQPISDCYYISKYNGTEESVILPTEYNGLPVTGIDVNAFFACTTLRSITIPENITFIDQGAFSGCSNLESAYFAITSGWANVTEMGKFICYRGDMGTPSGAAYQLKNPNADLKWFASYYSDGLVFEQVSGGYSVSSYSGTDKQVIIPSTYDNLPVISISENAFKNCTTITDIRIPNSITTIGDSAFWGCSGLTSITLPDSVTNLGSASFYGCTKLVSITLSDNIKSIEEFTFAYCQNLMDVTIPSGVTSIGQHAFIGCSQLININIPNGVTTIADHVFNGCSNLRSINIPFGVTSIGENAFIQCSKLTDITIPNTVMSIGASAFLDCIELTEVTIQSSFITIGRHAFARCTKLVKIHFDGAEAQWNSIEKNAYWDYETGNYVVYCTDSTVAKEVTNYTEGLTFQISGGDSYVVKSYSGSDTQVIIPNMYNGLPVIQISNEAFKNCTTISSVHIPNGIKSIGQFAFYGCTALTEIILPDSIIYIGDFAFADCVELSKLNIPEGIKDFSPSAFRGCTKLITKENGISYVDNWIIACDKDVAVEIRQGTVGIAAYVFSEYQLSNLILPSSLRYIGYGAFSSNTNLDTIKFEGEINLQYIGCSAFLGCDRISKVYIYDLEGWCNIEFGDMQSNPLYGADNLYLNDVLVTDLVIPEGVTQIHNHAFPFYTKLERIILPSTVESIGLQAFYRCESLKRIVIPSSVTSIGSEAFYNCSDLIIVYFTGTESEWNQISINTTSNDYLRNASRYYYSELQPTDNNYVYWHYVDGIPTKW